MGRAAPTAATACQKIWDCGLQSLSLKSISILIDEKQVHVATVM